MQMKLERRRNGCHGRFVLSPWVWGRMYVVADVCVCRLV